MRKLELIENKKLAQVSTPNMKLKLEFYPSLIPKSMLLTIAL